MGHIDFDTVGNADILHLLVVTELIYPQGAYQHGLDVFLPDDGLQVIVLGIDLDSQQLHVLDTMLVGNEATDVELKRGL